MKKKRKGWGGEKERNRQARHSFFFGSRNKTLLIKKRSEIEIGPFTKDSYTDQRPKVAESTETPLT